jgi:restriction system protein
LEELVAGGYEEYGGSVTLTPRSGDGGRDVIVVMPNFGTIRILDQVKLYAPNRPLPANDVRALYGVLTDDPAASKGVITTTSRFAPGVAEEFARRTPSRIELRDGQALREWLLRLKASS